MAQGIVSVRMDEALKQDFDGVCQELGMSMTTAITMLAKKMTREKRLPFEVSIDPFYSESNQRALEESIAQARRGQVVVKSLDDLERMADG